MRDHDLPNQEKNQYTELFIDRTAALYKIGLELRSIRVISKLALADWRNEYMLRSNAILV